MCIIQKSAKPTGVGVWWQDDTKWCRYVQNQEVVIRDAVRDKLSSVDLGLIASSVHPKGQRYTVDLEKMEQVAVKSGQRRPIMIIDADAGAKSQLQISGPPKLAIDGGPSNGSGFKVHYRDSSGKLVEYHPDIVRALLPNLGGRQRSVVLPGKKIGQFLQFDFETMEQCFVSASGEAIPSEKAPVKFIIEVPWNPDMMMNLVQKAESTTRRQILGMTIQRIRTEEYLTITLPERAHPRTIVGTEIETRPDIGDPRFEDFVTALEENLLPCPTGIESFLKLTVPGSSEDSKVQIVFKPFDKKRNEALEKRKKVPFWISMAAPIAAAHALVYGKAILKITPYLAILPNLNVTHAKRQSVLIDRADHYLPLVELQVR
ncbi:hypothetical protein R1sor_007469 [Riccia sorocarpa]|uniref:WWE domain-containing protein n=1 Tax=Riccia sorocarpa TaxID=122646 RepID=A0ABD3HQV2_9MARC